LMALLSTVVLGYCQPENSKMMPVTGGSRSALTTYKQAMKYFNDVNLPKAIEKFNEALKEDPDFFMANYQLAFFSILNRSTDTFEKYADAAISSKEKLNDGEEILKDALIKLKQGDTDVVEDGRKLVQMYPSDPEAYNNLISFQSLAGDSVGMVETIKKAITIAPDPAPFYNQLGYAYLTLKQTDKAEEAFNKYIELAPDNPNAYDSKGDYYMYVKEYDKAYEAYKKANTMDPSFSGDKAELAKHLYEQTEGKELNIISI
ncbi:MAG TPA: tetratricopeptide repeat protein, partial [Bacteroidales bacterium]|nr:tetratricopeptide repeat protein [Bacteroidales bacterium]